MPTIVRDQSLDADIDVVTTRAFLDGVERRERAAGTPPRVPTYWERVLLAARTANPRLQSATQRRPPGR